MQAVIAFQKVDHAEHFCVCKHRLAAFIDRKVPPLKESNQLKRDCLTAFSS